MSKYDALFRDPGTDGPINMVECPECAVVHKPSLRGERRCEACRMARVREAMARAMRGEDDKVTG